jgi:hypothetical protein
MRHTDFDRFSPERLKRQAARFSTQSFRGRLMDEVSRVA